MLDPNQPKPKSIAEVKEMVAALFWARNTPCDCLTRGNRVHAMQCVEGGRLMDAAIDALLWSISEPQASRPAGPNETILREYREEKRG